MNSVAWFGFAARFAFTDLVGRWRSLRVTLVSVFTVSVLTAFTFLIYGLVLGTEARELKRYRKDPAATSLIVRQPGRGLSFTTAAIAALRSGVGASLTADAPHHLLTQEWFIPGTETAVPCRGRTLADADPLLASFEEERYWLTGGAPAPGQKGIVITRTMLAKLDLAGVEKELLPAKLLVRTGVGREEVPIVGILDYELPGQRDYLITDGMWAGLLKKTDNPRAEEIRTGPLPEKWAAVTGPPGSVEKYLDEQGLEFVNRDNRPTGKAWKFRWKGEKRRGQVAAPTLREWQVHLENVARRLEVVGSTTDFATPDPIDIIVPPVPPLGGYDRVVLYVSDPDELAKAAVVVKNLGYELEDDRHEQIARIRKTSRLIFTLLNVVLVGIAGLGIWNLYLVQDLQAEQKVVEVGMLKAMGMPDGVLLLVYLLEAGLVWAVGLAGGLACGWGFGGYAEEWIARDDPKAKLAFGLPWPYIAGIVIASLLLCVGSGLVATRKARTASPMRCLGDR